MNNFLPIKKVGSNLDSISTDGQDYKVLHSYKIAAGTLTLEGDSMSVSFNGSFSNAEGSSLMIYEAIANVETCFSEITSFPSGFFKIETEFSRSTPQELKCQSTITINDSVSVNITNVFFNPLEDFNVEIIGKEVGDNASLTCEMSSLFLTKVVPIDPSDVIYLTATLPTNISQFPAVDLPIIYNQDYSVMNGQDFYDAIPMLDGLYPIFGQYTYDTFPILALIEEEYGITWLDTPPNINPPA